MLVTMTSQQGSQESVGGLSTGDKIASWIDAMTNNTVTFKNESGYFVSKKKIDQLENRLHKLMATGETSKSPDELIKLNEELGKVRRQLDLERESSAAAHKEVSNKSRQLQSLQEDLDSKTLKLKTMTAETEVWRKNNQNDLKDLERQCANLKIQAAKASKGFDPDLAVQLQQERDEMVAKVDALKGQLAEHNSFVAKSNGEIQLLKAKIGSLQIEKDHALRVVQQFERPEYADLIKNGIDIANTDKMMNTPILKQLIGDKGIEYLKKADLAMRKDVSSRAHNLWHAARSGKSKTMQHLANILKLMIDFIKTLPAKSRKIVVAWMEKIESDFRDGKLVSLKIYREELEKIISVYKASAEAKLQELDERKKQNKSVDEAEYGRVKAKVNEGSSFAQRAKAVFYTAIEAPRRFFSGYGTKSKQATISCLRSFTKFLRSVAMFFNPNKKNFHGSKSKERGDPKQPYAETEVEPIVLYDYDDSHPIDMDFYDP